MTDLLHRLCQATGPDRELDGVIFWLVERDRATRAYWNATVGMPKPLGEDIPARGLGRRAIEVSAPHYTGSIDAALTLVPKGWIVVSMTKGDLDRKYYDVRESSKWSVMIAKDGLVLKAPSEVLGFPSGTNESPAIALCTAALRARAAGAIT